MIHLGGRYCLSTTSGTVALCTSGVFGVSTLAVYNFPCDVSFVGMKASVATCPERLVVSLPFVFNFHDILMFSGTLVQET